MAAWRAILAVMALWMAGDAVAAPAARQEATVVLKLGEHVFEVPERYNLGATIPFWLKWLPGLDDGSHDALLEIPGEEAQAAVKGYAAWDNTFRQDLLIRVSALDPVSVAQCRDPAQWRDLWFATGEYPGRTVEPVPGTPWFRVMQDPQYHVLWHLFRRRPDPAQPLPADRFDYWIGMCQEFKTDRRSEGNKESCSADVLVGNLHISFHIDQQNLGVLDEVRAYVTQRVLSWRKSGPAR